MDGNSGDDRSLENKSLGNHMALQSNLAKTIAFMIRASMKAFIPGSILIMLCEVQTSVKYVKCIMVVSNAMIALNVIKASVTRWLTHSAACKNIARDTVL